MLIYLHYPLDQTVVVAEQEIASLVSKNRCVIGAECHASDADVNRRKEVALFAKCLYYL